MTLVLTKELQVSPDKSHKGGLRAARRAVRILNQLDKSSQVCMTPHYILINFKNYVFFSIMVIGM